MKIVVGVGDIREFVRESFAKPRITGGSRGGVRAAFV